MKLILVFLLMMNAVSLQGSIYHQNQVESEWGEEHVLPFDELILSWNAARPINGKYLFYVSVKTDEWSSPLLYASWGCEGQSSYSNTNPDSTVKVYQDALEVLEGKKANAFQIDIVADDGASLSDVHAIHVYTNGDKGAHQEETISDEQPIYLQVPKLSQMVLNHERHTSFCSPTSTTAVVRYLLNEDSIDPVNFAQHVWDSGFDIYGNWVFNVAQASVELGSSWNAWVERLNGFDAIYQRLQQGTPVVVSVRGPLPGSAIPYKQGHLIAVIGYDPLSQKVICMDPAFPENAETHVRYDLTDFVQAWGRRGNIAYIFSRFNIVNP